MRSIEEFSENTHVKRGGVVHVGHFKRKACHCNFVARAFDLDESHCVYETQGVDAYCAYQTAHENVLLQPGVAFQLVRKLLALNDRDPANPRVEIILLSSNSADTGLRIFNSIEHYQLAITRAAFSGGGSSHRYIQAFGAHLFLSSDQNDVQMALARGHSAATILPSNVDNNDSVELRIAFDGDSGAVLGRIRAAF